MSKSNSTENSFLDLLYSETAWANVAQNNSTSPITDIAVAAHTSDPGEGGAQDTNEAGYTDYARVNVDRSGGWTAASGGSISPVATISFPPSGAAGSSLTHFSTGKTGGGATIIFHKGTVTPNIAIGAAGITPQFSTASAITED